MSTTLPTPASPPRPKVNVKILAIGLAIVLPLVILLASGFGNDPFSLPSVLVGREAPAFTLTDLDGETWSLEELQGKPVIINFWASWCGPCRLEHPLLLQASRAREDVVFLGMLYSDTTENARRYLSRAGSAYPTLLDPDNHTAIDYGVAGVPETFFINRQGIIVHKHTGALTPRVMHEQLAEISKP